MMLFEVGNISLRQLSTFETISVENLDINKGTLHLSFYDMLKILHKHNIMPRILEISEYNKEIVGYCIFYSHNGNIQISHICIRKKYQRFGCGKQIIDWLKLCKSNTITADISYDNQKSKAFFEKMGFDFEANDEKKRWKATLKQ